MSDMEIDTEAARQIMAAALTCAIRDLGLQIPKRKPEYIHERARWDATATRKERSTLLESTVVFFEDPDSSFRWMVEQLDLDWDGVQSRMRPRVKLAKERLALYRRQCADACEQWWSAA